MVKRGTELSDGFARNDAQEHWRLIVDPEFADVPPGLRIEVHGHVIRVVQEETTSLLFEFAEMIESSIDLDLYSGQGV